MKLSQYGSRARGARSNAPPLIGLIVLAVFIAVTLASSAGAAATAVPLGTADSFVVLAGAGVTNTGPTTLNGDIGTYATTSITDLGTMTVNGTNHAGDGVTQQAKLDLVTAYNNAAGQGPTIPIVADLGGQTLTPGVYNSGSTIGLTGALTLDAGGNPNAVFVFQAGSGLTTASASQVNLTNGAQSCNVFWQIGSSAGLGSNSSFRGTIVALTSITVATGATIDGRVLAQTGTVTLDTNTITKPTCAPQAPNPTREIYCSPSGQAYDLIYGEDKTPPWNTLGLVPAHVDPVTGAKSCVAAVATTPTATTPTPTAPTPTTPTPTTPTPTKPTPKPAAPAPKTPAAPRKPPATSTPAASPSAAKHAFGLTG